VGGTKRARTRSFYRLARGRFSFLTRNENEVPGSVNGYVLIWPAVAAAAWAARLGRPAGSLADVARLAAKATHKAWSCSAWSLELAHQDDSLIYVRGDGVGRFSSPLGGLCGGIFLSLRVVFR